MGVSENGEAITDMRINQSHTSQGAGVSHALEISYFL